MTEAEWLACDDPQKMLGFLRGRGSDRKPRLFACACCRRMGVNFEVTVHDSMQDAVDLAERCADNPGLLAGPLAAAADAADRWRGVAEMMALYDPYNDGAQLLAEVADLTTGLVGATPAWDPGRAANAFAVAFAPGAYSDSPGNVPREGRPHFETKAAAHAFFLGEQAALARDIFGNPFRPVAFDPAWRTPTALRLAQAIYEERAFDRLPILADALEEAGCTGAELLAHCRSGWDHVRGCWLVDRVLGKE
jgi:hypothetical protein